MSSAKSPTVSLKFPLDIEDGWPPVAVESLPFLASTAGYQALVSPLFVKDLSVGDVIAPKLGDENTVTSWSHVHRSGRTTIWLLQLKRPNGIDAVLEEARALGCNSVGLETAGCYSIDVPEEVSIDRVDRMLATLDSDAVAVAFPSMRHPE
jgi:Domain of unknown function (DUF4265)